MLTNLIHFVRHVYIFGQVYIYINQRVVGNSIISQQMKQFIDSLKGIKLPQRTEEKLKIFDGKIHQIYRILERPRPHFEKQAIFEGNRINCIEQQQELQQISNNGIIIGRIYQLIDPSVASTEEKNVQFRGSCFLVTANIAICCSHQIAENKSYIIRIDGYIFKNKNQHEIKVKRIMKNSIQKIRPGQTKSQDYAFLVLEEKELKLKKNLENYLIKAKITSIEGIEDSMFNFDAKMYGYFEKLPKQFETEQKETQMWKKWAPINLIKSQGTAQYSNKELSYTMATEFGFSGAPIVIVDKNNYHIVGLHTRGSHFHSKGYGILFNQTFFLYLQKVITECFQEKEEIPSLQQLLNIVPLTKIVEHKKNLKEKLQKDPDIEFIGKAIEKILQRMEEFEDSELVVEQLKLQDIIISKVSQDDFFLDFSQLRFSELVQKGSEDQSNLQRIAQVIYEIKKIINIIPSVSKSFTPEQCYLKQQNNTNLNKKNELLLLIQKCIADSFNISWVYRSKSIKILLNKIRFSKSNYNLEEYLTLSSPYPIEQIKEEITIQQEFLQIIQMTQFKLYENRFRNKFCLLMKYSQEKLYDNVIARTYLLKLSSFYKHLEKVIQFFIWLTNGQRIADNNNSTENEVVYLFQLKLKRLKDLQMFFQVPKFTLLSLNFINKTYTDKQENEKFIKDTYQSILKSKKVYFSQDEINNLVKHEYIFCRTYFKCFDDLIKELNSYKHDKKLIISIKLLKTDIWQQKKQQILRKPPQTLNKTMFRTKPLDINRTKIFQDIFIDYENTTSIKNTQSIANMTSEQENKYENILNILVQIRGKDGKSKGIGFFLGKDTICTARHIFDGQILQNFELVNEKLQISCKILHSLASFDKNNVLSSDIIFFKVRVRIYKDIQEKNSEEKAYFSKSIYMLDNDIQSQKEFKEKSNFGLLIGLGSRGSSQSQIRPTKSYGQIQMNSKFHPLIGDHHLPGSPIFLRIAKQQKDKENIEYQYAIVGIYSGLEAKSKGYSTMQRFRAQSFNVEGSFLRNIEFPKLSTCIYRITDQLRQCIVKIYSSFDHFLLRVMGQVLRLNSLNIYLNKLSINNIILADKFLTDLAFSGLPINVHLQCGKQTQKMLQMKKLELETQNISAFAGFITDLLADKTHAIFNYNDFVQQSVLVDQLDMLNSSTSLKQYFTTCLQGKYYFDKENCLLKRIQASKQEIHCYRPLLSFEQSKFDMLYKRMPAQHLARINLGYSLLKNSIYQIDRIMIDNRSTMIEILVPHGKKLLQRYSKQKLDDRQFYFLAKKLIRDAIEETLFQYDKKKILNHVSQEKECTKFLEKFQSYLNQLTNFSNLSVSIRNDFINEYIRKANYTFIESKRWNLISEILNLYNSFQV